MYSRISSFHTEQLTYSPPYNSIAIETWCSLRNLNLYYVQQIEPHSPDVRSVPGITVPDVRHDSVLTCSEPCHKTETGSSSQLMKALQIQQREEL